MKHKQLRYRQVHLDFHTSPAIPAIGARFDAKQFQQALQIGHVDSITCFSTCHHGWSYHPTKVARMHPNLSFDLLRAQMDACKAIDVRVPVYLTAGVDNATAEAHPEWREIGVDGTILGWTGSPVRAGFKTLCFNTDYLSFLCDRIAETVTLFPEADGIFLDIIHQAPCCCPACMARMKRDGLDPENAVDRAENARRVLLDYYRRTTEACKSNNPDMPVFHNSGHITTGQRDILQYFSHLELESLPTGGWGYDHFPVSAKYVAGLGMPFLGMTGKFHTTWGEFGGYKHPNALRYECAAMIAFGSTCSVGDQLHPSGEADLSTYRVIGAAYAEVAAKEPWCMGARNVADIGLLASAANHLHDPADAHGRENSGDTGAARVLLEGHYLFDILDEQMELSPYRLVILPDDIRIGAQLQQKLTAYLAGGGSLLMSGSSGLDAAGQPLFDIGATIDGMSPFSPDFVQPVNDLRPELVDSPMVMYMRSRRLRVTTGESLGRVFDPYFNRTYDHFCSHQHTPYTPEATEFDAGVVNGRLAYLAHPVFSLYHAYGAVAYKRYIMGAIDRLLTPAGKRLVTNLPSTARVSMMRQAAEKRSIVHLLYANTIKRGAQINGSGGPNHSTANHPPKSVEVIEELLPLHGVELTVRGAGADGRAPSRVTLEPGGTPVQFEHLEGDGIRLRVEAFTCHQMVVIAD